MEEQRRQFDLLRKLNGLTAAAHPNDEAIQARMKFVRTRLPHADRRAGGRRPRSRDGPDEVRSMGWIGRKPGRSAVRCSPPADSWNAASGSCRFNHGGNGGAGSWDAHSGLKKGHERLCGQVDQPIGALLKDLKQRGLLDETLVGVGDRIRPYAGSQKWRRARPPSLRFHYLDGRRRHRGGVAHGATDELGFMRWKIAITFTDVHATVLHQLGLDPRRMVGPGRQRLERDFGRPIFGVIA